MKPLRGVVFSVMASSAFYPIIIKIFQVGWSRANAEYGASLYVSTICIYLCSVTIYAVSGIPIKKKTETILTWLFTAASDRGLETRKLWHLGPLTSDISRRYGDWTYGALLGLFQSRWPILCCQAWPMPGLKILKNSLLLACCAHHPTLMFHKPEFEKMTL